MGMRMGGEAVMGAFELGEGTSPEALRSSAAGEDRNKLGLCVLILVLVW
jgi:hypothetical protein